jgi:hypothetical protein
LIRGIAVFTACLGLAAGGFVWLPFSFIGLVLMAWLWFASADGGSLDPTNDRKGLTGERQVADVLASLDDVGVVAVHDLELGLGNVDHVAIGPTGVFAIETKNWAGRFSRMNGG